MRKLQTLGLVAALLLTAPLISSCGQSQTAAPESERARPVSLTISAASSLKDVMEEIKGLYTDENPHVTITNNFGSSGSLQQQIEQGAPADLFFSAATKQMDALQEKGLIAEDTYTRLLENKVALVVPKDSELVKDFTDLTKDDVRQIALGEPKSVPVGQYSQEVLAALGLQDSVKGKSVYGKDAKEVLTWVATGNADAGMVYLTDAKASKDVKVVAMAPDSTHTPVVYPAAVIKGSTNAEAAKAFLAFLSGGKAKAVFEKYGFTPLK